MISECRIDNTIAHLGFEKSICDILFVLNVNPTELIIVVMAHDISGEYGEDHIAFVNELIHGGKRGESQTRRGLIYCQQIEAFRKRC